MTDTIFREYLRWFNLQMAERKVLLLIDGFSSHHAEVDLLEAQDIELTNVKVEFLPANTTAICITAEISCNSIFVHLAAWYRLRG